MIDQIGIALTGVTAIALSQSGPRAQRYACLFGLAGQPFWVWSAWHADQFGILVLTALYTAAWAKGIWTHWLQHPEVRAANATQADHSRLLGWVFHRSRNGLFGGRADRDSALSDINHAVSGFGPCWRGVAAQRDPNQQWSGEEP